NKKMKATIALIGVLFFTIVLTSCAINNDPFATDTNSNISAATDGGITTVGSIADDLVTGIAGITSIDESQFYNSNLVSVDSCSGNWTSCSAGLITRDVSCGDGSLAYTKNMVLTFSAAPSCSFSSNGEYFVKTHTATITGPNGGSYTSTSDAATNYFGDSIFGGTKITYNSASNYNIDILGINKKLAKNDGTVVWNHSIRTTSGKPLVINHFRREGRVISSGQLVINHNLAYFTTTMDFNSVTYKRGCCYPITGSITATFTGQIKAVKTITFNQCGFATITDIDGTFINMQFFGCENNAAGDDATL
ncbi:MAG: hypothetical protein WCQ47_07085, partial [bacterium]